jgi:hypothetical protein
MTNDASERAKQRALEVLERSRNAADKVRRDAREFTEGVLAIHQRVLEEGEYPAKKLFSDAVTTTLHGLAIWTSWWMPALPESGSSPAQKPEPRATERPKK